jgi:hypothetical protein
MANEFTIGKNCQVNLVDSDGNFMPLQNITSFEVRSIIKTICSEVLNGPPRELRVLAGWEFTITLDREDNSLDKFWNRFEQSFWVLGGTAGVGSIYQYSYEIDKTVSTYWLQEASFSVDLGSWKNEAAINQKIGLRALSHHGVDLPDDSDHGIEVGRCPIPDCDHLIFSACVEVSRHHDWRHQSNHNKQYVH